MQATAAASQREPHATPAFHGVVRCCIAHLAGSAGACGAGPDGRPLLLRSALQGRSLECADRHALVRGEVLAVAHPRPRLKVAVTRAWGKRAGGRSTIFVEPRLVDEDGASGLEWRLHKRGTARTARRGKSQIHQHLCRHSSLLA